MLVWNISKDFMNHCVQYVLLFCFFQYSEFCELPVLLRVGFSWRYFPVNLTKFSRNSVFVLKIEKYSQENSITAWKVAKYRVFSCPYFPAFVQDTKIYFVSLCIYFAYRKVQNWNNSTFGINIFILIVSSWRIFGFNIRLLIKQWVHS